MGIEWNRSAECKSNSVFDFFDFESEVCSNVVDALQKSLVLMSSITPEAVKKISKLACVHVLDEDVEAMAKDLNSILQWITHLQELDISGIELHQACSESMPENDDVVTEVPQVEKILENAPDRVDSWFVVPKMIDA